MDLERVQTAVDFFATRANKFHICEVMAVSDVDPERTSFGVNATAFAAHEAILEMHSQVCHHLIEGSEI